MTRKRGEEGDICAGDASWSCVEVEAVFGLEDDESLDLGFLRNERRDLRFWVSCCVAIGADWCSLGSQIRLSGLVRGDLEMMSNLDGARLTDCPSSFGFPVNAQILGGIRQDKRKAQLIDYREK